MSNNIRDDKKFNDFYEKIKKESEEYLKKYANSFKDHY